MTAPTDQFIDIARISQDAVTSVARTWADSVQSLADNLTPGQARLPDPQAYVDNFFDFAEKVLSNQREIAHQWINAAAKATEAVTEQAARATQSVAAHSANGAEAVADTTADAARATGDKAVSTARAARTAARA